MVKFVCFLWHDYVCFSLFLWWGKGHDSGEMVSKILRDCIPRVVIGCEL